ncbi:MAG TPA: aspartate aminotransferase family protein [Dermatophilaceae bacterium]|nr:aspartate aminotransferase family protein [Dermatophilaceae bacterium]
MTLSEAPLSLDEIRARLVALRDRDLPVHGGRTLAYVYDSGRPDVDALASEALAAYGGTNGLDPTAFPSLAVMERDLVRFAARLLGASDAAGTVTSGGTESCLLAVYAAREAWRAGDPDRRGQTDRTTRPRIVAPTSVHAAFHKAAHLFGLELVLVDVDPVTQRADTAAMGDALDDDTALVVVSAPSYPHGVVDDVTPIAAAAAARGIRVHVDACIGGWVLPFLSESDCPAWDLTVPGVTSISVDLHKYGYASKGVSLLLHRTAELRRPQVWATAAWPGYAVVNPTLQSTRSGGPLAAAWAVVAALGVEGFAELARQARAVTLAVAGSVREGGIPGLRVLVEPDSSLLALTTDESADVYTVADELLERGWYAQPQLPYRDTPATLHLTLSAATARHTDELLAALREATTAARAAGPCAVDPALGAALAGLDPAHLDARGLDGLLAAAGLSGVGDGGSVELPSRMAPIHTLLAQCPPAVREALLTAVLERL